MSAVARYVCYLLLTNVFVSLACFKKSGVFNFTLFAACATSLGQYFPLKNKKLKMKLIVVKFCGDECYGGIHRVLL